MNKQQLASKIWESANKMRSKIEANEYKDYILGFIFYKYLSNTELRFLRENDFTEADIRALSETDAQTVEFVQNGIGYFIAYENLFSTWLEKGRDFDVSNVNVALSAFSGHINPTHKKVFDGILRTLETGLSKLGESAQAQTKAIRDLVYLIRDIPMDGKQDYDVLGFIYEYLIGMFAANAGKKAGEFYTPHEVSLLMSEIVAHHLKDRKEIKIYDPTSGSGSLLINIGRSVAKHFDREDKVKYYAQEIKENTYNLTRMNLVMRGILPDNITTRNGDTLEDDWPLFEDSDPAGTYTPLFVDAVVSNPPYSQAWDPKSKGGDTRFKDFGLAPKTKADFAFLLHDLYHLKPDGIMTIVLPHGVLFRGGDEGEIRRKLVEKNHIDAVIGLPANIFFGTSIPTVVVVLKKNRASTDVLVIDASKGFAKRGKNNVLRASDIRRITDAVAERATVEKFSRVVSQDEIRGNGHNLNIPRYVDSSEAAESWDIYATMFGGIPKTEIARLSAYWDAFPGLESALFADNGTPYCELATDDVGKTVEENAGVVAWRRGYEKAFAGFWKLLDSELVDKMLEVNRDKEEAVLCAAVFECLAKIPLVDKYSAFQALDDAWAKIAVDLEILQTEGFDAAKTTEPNMVPRKKDGKEQEIQEGWSGRVIPFALAEASYLGKEAAEVRRMETRLADIDAAMAEILDSLSEEEKESDVVNEDRDAFVAARLKKITKDIAKAGTADYDEDSFEGKLVRAQKLKDEESTVKKRLKKEAAALHMRTKRTIENLTREQATELLREKWLAPLTAELNKIPLDIVSGLVSRVRALADKYATTYAEVVGEIAETKSSLASLIDELAGGEYDMKGLVEFKSMLRGE